MGLGSLPRKINFRSKCHVLVNSKRDFFKHDKTWGTICISVPRSKLWGLAPPRLPVIFTICIYIWYSSLYSLCSVTAREWTADHTVLPATHMCSQKSRNGISRIPLYSQPQSVNAHWPVLIFHPVSVGLDGWLQIQAGRKRRIGQRKGETWSPTWRAGCA